MSDLLFVYNADSGLANALLDTGRRIFKPDEYPCSLCKVTYGPFGMKRDWKRFTDGLPYKTQFLHKDELPAKYQMVQLKFPCVLLVKESEIVTLVSASEFAGIKDLDSLIDTVSKKLQPYQALT